MAAPMRELYIIVITIGSVIGRTIKYQIVTRDDGRKEILNNETKSLSPDLRFLVEDLNVPFNEEYQTSSTTTEVTPIESTTNNSDALQELNDHLLMSKLNSYTTNGWTGQKNAVYANSTKLIIFDARQANNDSNDLAKQGRSENFTEEVSLLDVPIEQPGLWEIVEKLYDCFNDFSKHGTTINCLKSRATAIFLKFLDQSVSLASGKSVEQKTLKHGKKFLKGALLPLLVLLVIKYLIALPVIAAGLITIKTFWLSLLSAGVAAFGAPWKQTQVVKRYRPEAEHVWTQPAWTSSLHPPHDVMPKIGTDHENYFM